MQGAASLCRVPGAPASAPARLFPRTAPCTPEQKQNKSPPHPIIQVYMTDKTTFVQK